MNEWNPRTKLRATRGERTGNQDEKCAKCTDKKGPAFIHLFYPLVEKNGMTQ
jgi:hypothetical protein